MGLPSWFQARLRHHAQGDLSAALRETNSVIIAQYIGAAIAAALFLDHFLEPHVKSVLNAIDATEEVVFSCDSPRFPGLQALTPRFLLQGWPIQHIRDLVELAKSSKLGASWTITILALQALYKRIDYRPQLASDDELLSCFPGANMRNINAFLKDKLAEYQAATQLWAEPWTPAGAVMWDQFPLVRLTI